MDHLSLVGFVLEVKCTAMAGSASGEAHFWKTFVDLNTKKGISRAVSSSCQSSFPIIQRIYVSSPKYLT